MHLNFARSMPISLLLLVLTLLLGGCSGSSGTNDAGVQVPAGPASPAGLPELDSLDSVRQPSVLGPHGVDPLTYTTSGGTVVDQSPDLLLDSSAGGTSWAVYSLNTAGTYAVNLKMEFSSPGDPGAWLAVANFDRGHWQFEPMYTSSPAEIPISLNHAADYISPLGNFYFAALSYDDLDVVVNSLTVELAEAPPPTFKISGNISDGSNPLAGIQVGLEPGGLSATTNLSGNYSFSGLLAGNYTLTPTDSGYEFAPLNRNAVITDANLTGQDFTGTVVQPPVTYVDDIAPLLAGSTGESSCTGCHGGISPNLESYAQVSANANLIKTEVNLSSGGMPPGGPQWSQANRDLFQAWIDGGKIEQ